MQDSEETHLLEGVGVEENPAELNHLCRILGHINAVLVAGGGNMDDDVSIHAELRALLRRHIFLSLAERRNS